MEIATEKEYIKKALKLHAKRTVTCDGCPLCVYNDCTQRLSADALSVIEDLEDKIDKLEKALEQQWQIACGRIDEAYKLGRKQKESYYKEIIWDLFDKLKNNEMVKHDSFGLVDLGELKAQFKEYYE